MAMALTIVLALSLGVYAASRHNKLGDVGVMAASQLGIARWGTQDDGDADADLNWDR